MVPLQAQCQLIARAAVAHESDDHAALEELVQTDSWKTLMTLMHDQANSKGTSPEFSPMPCVSGD